MRSYTSRSLLLSIENPNDFSPFSDGIQFWNFSLKKLGHDAVQGAVARKPYLSINADIVDVDIRLLIGLDFLDEERLVPDNLENKLISKDHGWELPLTRRHGHMFLEWNFHTILLTKGELLKLHRHFFHPSTENLFGLFKRGYRPHGTSQVRKVLRSIADECLRYK